MKTILRCRLPSVLSRLRSLEVGLLHAFPRDKQLGLALYDSEEGKRGKRKVEREEREREEEEEESLWKKINLISVLLGSSELFLKVSFLSLEKIVLVSWQKFPNYGNS